jgi:pimeloyl-ACP methyl ester carboxylesterase
VLLPGLNGSDRLFAPLLPWLDSQLTVQTLSLPQEGSQDHQQLAEALRSQLGETPFVLLGESFSGALAHFLGMLKPPGLRGLIFVASFLQRPQPLLRALPKATLPLPLSLLTNNWLLKTFCIGKFASPELLALLRTEIDSIGNALLWARLLSLAQMQPPSGKLELPALQLLAEHDRLVTRRASSNLSLHCNDLQQITIAGPHFLLQSQPAACAHVINHFIAALAAR